MVEKISRFYEFTPLDRFGDPFDLHRFENKLVLIVNVASKCGLVQQYQELEDLYQKYKNDGLEIIAFPCNQFGGQEPEQESQIVEFCKTRYGVTFPILKKIEVNGRNAAPLYDWLKHEKPGAFGFKGIKWNFEKFLIDRNGTVVKRYGSVNTPAAFERDIQQLL